MTAIIVVSAWSVAWETSHQSCLDANTFSTWSASRGESSESGPHLESHGISWIAQLASNRLTFSRTTWSCTRSFKNFLSLRKRYTVWRWSVQSMKALTRTRDSEIRTTTFTVTCRSGLYSSLPIINASSARFHTLAVWKTASKPKIKRKTSSRKT